MAIRQCPACLTTASMGTAVAYTNDFICAGCGHHLEVSEPSCVLASSLGIVAGYFVIKLVPPLEPTLEAATSALYALLAYGSVSALVLMFTADLRIIPAPSQPVAAAEAHAPQDGHH